MVAGMLGAYVGPTAAAVADQELRKATAALDAIDGESTRDDLMRMQIVISAARAVLAAMPDEGSQLWPKVRRMVGVADQAVALKLNGLRAV
jgi:hypothetical protein